MGELQRLVFDKLKLASGPVVNPLVSSVGTSAARVLRNNPDRLGALLVNLSANTLYFSPFGDVSSTKGIRVEANGGGIELLWEEDLLLVGQEWYAVASAAGSAIYVLEFVAVHAPGGP